jgi:hypothetical protein
MERYGACRLALSQTQKQMLRYSIEQGILNEVWKNKLIFVETPDANETSIALENYRRVNIFRMRNFRNLTYYLS